jgi:nicotinamidase-related amidase
MGPKNRASDIHVGALACDNLAVGVSTQLHQWRIDDREYQRHEHRRGRRFAYEVPDPSRTCLVVVDMVRFFVDHSAYARGIVTKVNRAATALRDAGGSVAWVVPSVGTPTEWQVGFYGTEIAESYAASGGSCAPADRVAAELNVEADDLVVEKSAASAFFPGRCDLHDHLRQAGITRVMIAGTVTSVCCESTARDAAALGYEVIFLGDATADSSDLAHNAALRTVYRSFGDVRSVDELFDFTMKP